MRIGPTWLLPLLALESKMMRDYTYLRKEVVNDGPASAACSQCGYEYPDPKSIAAQRPEERKPCPKCGGTTGVAFGAQFSASLNTSERMGMELKQLLDADTPKKREVGEFYLLGVELTKMTNLDEGTKGAVVLQCIEVGKKLAKVADAVDNYHRLEKRELKKLVKSAQSRGNNLDLTLAHDSTRLQASVEEALAQSKSALDVASKILRPLVGIQLPTFGKKGQTVIKALQRNLPDDLKPRAEGLIALIEDNKQQLTMIINHRNDQHLKNLEISPLRIDPTGNQQKPYMPDGQAVSEFTEALFNYVFLFLQDFLVLAIYIKLIPGLVVVAQGTGRKRQFRVGI